MFEHEHHQTILRILNALDPAIFDEVGAYFGGGTLITLLYEEYRWSKDVDFICPIGPGYRRLRQIVSEASFKFLASAKLIGTLKNYWPTLIGGLTPV